MSVRLTWMGQSGFQIKTAQKIVYIDLVYYKKYEKKIGGLFEKADLILVTHAHGDHCQPATIEKVRTEATVVIAPSHCAKKIKGEVEVLNLGEEKDIDGIMVRAAEAYNVTRFRAPGTPWHPKGYGNGYLITIAGETIYHAGDTDFIPEMRNLGNVNVALLPTGNKYTMDNSEAAQAAIIINPEVVLSMHRWDTDPEVFKQHVEANSGVKVVILHEGESYEVI
ncbi:MAG: MBL fold metallo-hydrolase [Theionarchaea archaeon]|nr:MBL fold metallo-hydrolase [Theionarchaea archaeon]MBU7036280.1 MBL fold metallo-hydrolase [Theionarchaea archaeon]MBU7041932.1 MBL fold metallo-hydrolase [Theionarchaea archaeon]